MDGEKKQQVGRMTEDRGKGGWSNGGGQKDEQIDKRREEKERQ